MKLEGLGGSVLLGKVQAKRIQRRDSVVRRGTEGMSGDLHLRRRHDSEDPEGNMDSPRLPSYPSPATQTLNGSPPPHAIPVFRFSESTTVKPGLKNALLGEQENSVASTRQVKCPKYESTKVHEVE